jgi:hypothetical protein
VCIKGPPFLIDNNLELSKAKHTPRFVYARTHAIPADIIPPADEIWNCYKEKEAYFILGFGMGRQVRKWRGSDKLESNGA